MSLVLPGMMNWIKAGKIGPPQGLNGSFFLVGDGAFDSGSTSAVIGKDPSCGIPVSLSNSHFTQGHWILRIQGIEDRKALNEIRGQDLWIEAQAELVHELVGIQVVNDAKTVLGEIIAVTNHGASDIAVVKGTEKKYVDLPLIPDFFMLPGNGKTIELKVAESSLAGLWYS